MEWAHGILQCSHFIFVNKCVLVLCMQLCLVLLFVVACLCVCFNEIHFVSVFLGSLASHLSHLMTEIFSHRAESVQFGVIMHWFAFLCVSYVSHVVCSLLVCHAWYSVIEVGCVLIVVVLV